MDCDAEYIAQSKTNPHLRRLEQFLSNEKFRTPKGCPYTNIINQYKGATYFIPFTNEQNNAFKPVFSSLDLDPTDEFGEATTRRVFSTPIEELFYNLEECRRNHIKLSVSETQYFHVPPLTTQAKAISVKVNAEGDIDDIEQDPADDIAESVGTSPTHGAGTATDEPKYAFPARPSADELSRAIPMDKSCIELDFDIYQKDPVRAINDTNYFSLVHVTAGLLQEILDFESCKQPQGVVENLGGILSCTYHVVILRKPDIVECAHPEYGRCYKDSFHCRIFIKVSKEVKKYIIKQIYERGILQHVFNGIQIVNPLEKVLDAQSASFPAMVLGSMKRGGKVAHEFYKLYQVQVRACNNALALITVKNDFDPTPGGPAVKVPDPADRRRKILKTPPNKYKYNLCYETSLLYEDPNGLIKKRAFEPRREVAEAIRTYSERAREDLIPRNELEEVRNHVTDLIVRNYEAKYLQKILDIISPARVASYEDWKDIIVMLAKANPDYKPLAVWFSHRCPQSWVKNGLQTLEGIWQWALNESESSHEDGKPRRTIATLFAWAKEDNPTKYEEIQDYNAFMKIKNIAMENCGLLHETHIAEVLKTMFGKKFICDESEFSTARSRERHWYEFVFPDDEVGRTHGALYKWRREKYPDNLDKYVSKKLPLYVKKITEWVDTKIEQGAGEEEAQRFYETLKKNLRVTIHNLGKKNMINNIISRCEVEFRERGFEETLNTDPNVIGVGNGVLRVYPKTELIQRYHEIPISRSMEVDYEPYDANNPYVQVLERELRRLFAGEEDAFTFTMCYLGSSLDGRKKNPLFFIWLGEGSNGKSFLLELHINTLHKVVKGGYGAKLNVAFFTQERKGAGGPDSEKMMLKHARFAYCSESNEGEVLIMSKIKEFTSETLSGNEKHQTQDMFEANCHYVFCSNNDPRVTGRDYGTWRRLLVYRFKMMFIDNPNPKNKYEYKRDPKFVNIVTKDPNYKKAYLSILMRYYEMYRDKYNCDLNNIPKPTIDRETRNFQNEQDTVSRFISEQCVRLGKETKDVDGKMKKVRDINLVDVANRFIAWHVAKIDDRRPIRSEVLKALRNSPLKNFIVDKFTGAYLTEHRILEVGEDYDASQNDEEKPEAEMAAEAGAEETEEPEEPEEPEETEEEMIDDLEDIEDKKESGKGDNIIQEELIDDLD